MSLGTNIQFYRKKKEMTQEELAASMEVSRQTISKWESDSAFPETDKLIRLSDMFGCTLDCLLKGSAEESFVSDTAGYDKEMNSFTKAICFGSSLVLAGVAVMCLLYGLLCSADGNMSSAAEVVTVAALLIFVAVSAAVFIVAGIRHGNFVKDNPHITPFYDEQRVKAFRNKFPVYIAVGTVIVLVSVILLLSAEAFPLPEGMHEDKFYSFFGALFFLGLTVAVPFFIYGGMQYSKYDIDSYNKENNPEKEPKDKVKSAINAIIMLTATAAYLMMGFLGNLWHIGWVVFPVGGILCAIVSVISEAREK